uniref:Uncharacterized protein n=1 Tax=Magallana gigas TaxID=29159 RepID=A0A8W8J7V7_MAGGI|nr:uncharacterized protein LOC117690832 [Crassostrea gigas]
MDKKSTRQLKEIKRIWIQGLREIKRLGDGKAIEEEENWNGKSEEKREKQSGQSKKKAKNQTGQSEKKAKKPTGQSAKKAKNQTGESEKKAKNQGGQSEKKARNQARQSEEKAEKQTGQSEKAIYDNERREFGSNHKEKPVKNHWRQRNYTDFCPRHCFKLLKSILGIILVFSHCAWVDGLGYGQQENKTVFGIFQHTVSTVSHCPHESEYMKRASDKCAVACGRFFQTEYCAYHCMRDSSKKSLVEFCANPVRLFDYCPVYDLRGQRIQKDFDALCKKSKSFQRHYNSSDIFFCDPENCLQLQDASGSTDLTGLVTEAIPSDSGDINDTLSPQYWYMPLLFSLAVIAVLVIACIFRMRKKMSAWFGKITSSSSEEKRENEVFIHEVQTKNTTVQM